MSKPVKDMISREYAERFGELDGVVIVDIRGIEANDNRALRSELRKKQIQVTVVKNALASRALAETALARVKELLKGPCAFAYGIDADTSVVNVARELLEKAKKVGELELKGAVMEGAIFGPDEVERLSKFPTREEALAQYMTLILSPGRTLMRAVESPGEQLAGAIRGPAGLVAGLIATVKDKLEKGETISK